MNPPEDFDESAVAPVVRRRRPQPAGAGEPSGSGDVQRAERPRSDPRADRPRPDPRAERPRSDPHRTDPDGADEDYVVLPASPNGARRLLTLLGVVVLLVGVLVGGVLLWASRQVNPGGDPGELVSEVVVPSGASTDAIAGLLADEGVITNARLFRYYVSWQGAGPWNAGTYVDFRLNSSFQEAIDVLDAGPVPAEASVVRIIEGTRLEDALGQIAAQLPHLSVEVLQQTLDSGAVTSSYKPPDAPSWEGMLFPDSYQFDDDVPPQVVLQTMADKMDSVLDSLGYDKADALQGRSAYELVTIASLIEKETGAPPEERGMISRVIVNRLDAGETLGIDATVLYGLGRTSGELTRTDLDTDTPYNSRLRAGLPPTPIALPGEASLAAAIAPADGDWRYYVLTSNEPPSHFFTDSYREFLAARDDARERGVF